jgi:hypothetical protein
VSSCRAREAMHTPRATAGSSRAANDPA